jgi:DNA-3-methyladenine glycosylase I
VTQEKRLDENKRCSWVKLSSPEYVAYHDHEWGKPLRCSRGLFELFSLETQSSGLSWLTILKKREGYRVAFEGFFLEKVARYTESDVDRIFQSGLVVKSRPKIKSIIHNAKVFLEIESKGGSLEQFFWQYVEGAPIVNTILDCQMAPCRSKLSDRMCKDFKKKGVTFVGSVTLYAFMQASGMVNDHENGCFCKNRCV